MNPLIQEQLDCIVCHETSCENKDHEVIHLHGKCHPGNSALVLYRKDTGVLSVMCGECRMPVAEILVARGITIESLLADMKELAAESNAVVYQILFRRAGVGIQWHEESRSTTKEYDGADMQIAIAISKQRTQEGLIVYHYSPDLRTAIVFELRRLRAAQKDPA